MMPVDVGGKGTAAVVVYNMCCSVARQCGQALEPTQRLLARLYSQPSALSYRWQKSCKSSLTFNLPHARVKHRHNPAGWGWHLQPSQEEDKPQNVSDCVTAGELKKDQQLLQQVLWRCCAGSISAANT